MATEQMLRSGQHIAELRNSKGMTRRELASAMNRHYQWIWNIETGRRELSVPAARKMAQLLNVTVGEILGDSDHASM